MAEREQQVTSIFHSALAREGTERHAFLDGACADDSELRREVEELIRSHESAGSFIASPAYERGAALLERRDETLIGRSLAQYRVISLLGAGGMGDVYLAEDTRLDRRVALKILPTEVARDVERMRRFVREAKAASALNHPNIITIYEIGENDGSQFIATEHIAGKTLRDLLHDAPNSLDAALEIAIQVVSALDVAHQAGIVHRDIKPENVMVRPDGLVKLLDFGIAKLTETPGSSTDTEAPTKAMVNTGAGTVIGTANYMSPEQAKGTPVDTRTDLWSVGVVLYEMIAGCQPFSGETPNEAISLILQKDPPPLARYTREVPAELERIVTKSLAKKREERYQTAKDLLIDLRSLKRKLEVNAEIDRTSPPEPLLSPATIGGQNAGSTAGHGATTGAASARQYVSSAEYVVTGIKQHKRAVVFVVAAILVIGALSVGSYLRTRPSTAPIDSIAVMPFENQNSDADSEYMSDGLTDSIINSLTQVPNLKVIARSSMFRYKGKQSDPLAVAKELGVRAVLTGRLVQRGDNLAINTELIDATNNQQIWGERFERKVSDLMSVQGEIAQEISGKLRLKLSRTDEQQLTKHNTDNPDAYQSYLKGRFYWNKRTYEGLKKSIDYFNQALENDPSYALAYAGLADSWFTMGWYGATPVADAFPRARTAALKAIALDPELSEPHATLAMIKAMHDWDWMGAEYEFKVALQLNPKYPTAHQRYSLFLPILGRFDEALVEARKAQELDPLSLSINENVGDMLRMARRYDEAEQQLLKTIEMDPDFENAHETLSLVYEAKGMPEKYIEQAYKGATPEVRAHVKKIYAQEGQAGLLRYELADMLKDPTASDFQSFYIAGVYALLNDKDKSFEWLNKSVDKHAMKFTYLRDQKFDNLVGDPRYDALLKRVGLK